MSLIGLGEERRVRAVSNTCVADYAFFSLLNDGRRVARHR
jgi:hypothetical protein